MQKDELKGVLCCGEVSGGRIKIIVHQRIKRNGVRGDNRVQEERTSMAEEHGEFISFQVLKPLMLLKALSEVLRDGI